MFNFSANHLVWLHSKDFDRARVSVLKDIDTNRCYKVYDYGKHFSFNNGEVYCVSGKVNSADKLYLILESVKQDKRYLESKTQYLSGNIIEN